MTTESWDEYFKPNLTWNHAWGSAPANITARKLMGIEPMEATFSRFRISPQPGTLEKASIKVPCMRGAIKCDLTNKTDQWQLTVSVPGNSEAELWLPARFNRVSINGSDVTPIRDTPFAGRTRKVYPLESGLHTILAQH